MFKTSSMILGKAVKGKLKNSTFMGARSFENTSNAAMDITDYQVDRSFMTEAYRVNAWIRSIVDAIAKRATQVDVFPMPLEAKLGTITEDLSTETRKKMENVINLLIKPNSDGESFDSLREKVFRDVSIYDEAGIQIVKSQNYLNETSPYSLYANVTGEELFVNPKRNGTLPSRDAYVQMRNREVLGSWNKNEFLNFIQNRRAGYANGFSPIESCVTSIIGDLEAMNYNLKFFENNARPDFAFVFEQLGFGKGKESLERAKAWYLQEHQGKPHLPLFMGSEKGNVKIQEFKTTQKDMQFFEWQMLLLSRILAVYGCQPFVIGVITETTGKLNSEVQSEQFKKNAIMPAVRMFTEVLNSGLIWNDSNFNYDDIYLTSTQLDLEDEQKQAEIDEKYLDRGVITINQVRNKLQMPPVEWGDLPFVPLNYAPYDTLVRFQESKIASNATKATTDGIDNNVLTDDQAAAAVKEYGVEGLYYALYADEFESTSVNYLVNKKSQKLPSGLDKVEPTELKEVITKLVKMREKHFSKTYSFGNHGYGNVIKQAQSMGLSWKKIMKSR